MNDLYKIIRIVYLLYVFQILMLAAADEEDFLLAD